MRDNSFIELPKQAQFASYLISAFESREGLVVCYLENIVYGSRGGIFA